MLIDKPENRERVLKAIRDYNEQRKAFMGQQPQDRPPEGERGLFDRELSNGHDEAIGLGYG